MGSLTYTSWAVRFDAAMAAFAKTGALVPRPAVPAPALTAMRDDVTRLIQKWDNALADCNSTNNLYVDVDKDRRQREFAALREKHGNCRAEGPFVAENALRGEWVMALRAGRRARRDHACADRAAQSAVSGRALRGYHRCADASSRDLRAITA